MKIRAAFLLSASFAPGLLTSHAQKPAPPPAKSDYAKESTVVEHLTRIYRYAADGTGTKQITGVIDVRDEAAVKGWSVLSYSFASSAEDFAIDYVRVRRPDGTLIPTPAADAQQLPSAVTREAPFYSDIKEEQIPVRSLQPGDHLEYQFRITRNRPEAPNQFWGQEAVFTPSSSVVALDEIVELHIPASKYANVWSPRLKPTISEADGERIYRWQSSQLKPVAGLTHNQLLLLDNDPDLGTNDDQRLPPIAWTSFHSWPEVGAWYRSLEGARTQPDDDVRSRVATLIAGKLTAEDKARALYGYVGPQIRYIGVAFGVGRFQPHEAGDVLRNQYGDCKDKTTLLVSMLTLAGIPTDAVLIGAGVPFNPDVPSPGAFNHAINLAHVDGQLAWLDATSEVAPYRLLLPQIRGVKALVIPLTGDAHIETTPTDTPFPMVDRFTAIGTLDDQGTSHSHMTLDLRGDNEVAFRVGVHAISPAQWDEAMQRVSQAMSFAGKVTNAKFSRADDTADPFHIEYDYEREKSGDWDNLRILPQFEPVGLGEVDEKDPPVTPIELGYPHVEISHSEMTLPKGWNADLPASVHAKSSFATLDKTYKFEKGVITTDRRFEVLKKDIPASEWHAYQSWYKEAKLDGELYIQLLPASGSAKPRTYDQAAADLITAANQDERAGKWSDAKKKIDQAKKINAKQPYLWSNYGFIARYTNKIDDAIEDYKREIAAYPNETLVYRLLAEAQTHQNNMPDAIATLHAGVDANPTDESLVLYLSSLLMSRGENADAEKVLRAGLAATPSSVQIKLSLGTTLAREGKTGEAVPLLSAIVTTSDDPLQLNNAAYELGNATVELPLAEKASRRSIELLNDAINAKQGTTATPTDLAHANLLVDAWDTLGWILFREGKVDEAEPWVRAAWRNGQRAEPGYHLAVILEKQGHPQQALDTAVLASSDDSSSNTDAVKKLISTKIAALTATGISSTLKNPKGALQDQRTYKLPRPPASSHPIGWVQVEFSLAADGVSSIQITDEDKTLQSQADTIKHITLNLDLPPDPHATLIRRGVLSCHNATECELVLIPPDTAATER